MRIGNCDHCGNEGYVSEGYDSFGVHVVDVCYYTCGSVRNDPTYEKPQIDIVGIQCINKEAEYGSIWSVQAKLSGEVHKFTLNHSKNTSLLELTELISECWMMQEIADLEVYEYKNETIAKHLNDKGYREKSFSVKFNEFEHSIPVNQIEEAFALIDTYQSSLEEREYILRLT